jgi:hypothetical protein
MTAPWLTFFAIIGVAVLYVIVPIVADTFMRFRDRRIVHCPEQDRPARVQIDATLAAMTAVPGPPKLMVERCSFWPDRADCAQRCTRHMT